jgi:hypothetical protein
MKGFDGKFRFNHRVDEDEGEIGNATVRADLDSPAGYGRNGCLFQTVTLSFKVSGYA